MTVIFDAGDFWIEQLEGQIAGIANASYGSFTSNLSRGGHIMSCIIQPYFGSTLIGVSPFNLTTIPTPLLGNFVTSISGNIYNNSGVALTMNYVVTVFMRK